MYLFKMHTLCNYLVLFGDFEIKLDLRVKYNMYKSERIERKWRSTVPNHLDSMMAMGFVETSLKLTDAVFSQELKSVAGITSEIFFETGGPFKESFSDYWPESLSGKEAVLKFASMEKKLILDAESISSFVSLPLWPGGVEATTWLSQSWDATKEVLNGLNDDWHVWVDWYQDRLDGKPANKDLELAKAQIPNELWEAGPATVNAEIARLNREHEGDETADRDSKEDPNAREVDAAISIHPEVAIDQTEESALSDFRVDEDTNETRTTPMPDDPPPPEDPYRMRDQSVRLSVLKDLAKNLHTAFLRDKPQVPTSLRLDLNNYAKEAAELPENVRPRMLIVLGDRFAIALEDDDIRAGMSNYLVSSLEGFVQEHAGLVAAFYRGVAEQAQQRAAEVEAQPVERLQELEAAILESAKQIEQLGEQGAPKPASGFLADLRAEMASLREQQERLPLISDEAARQAGARQISVSFTQWSATQVRHVARIVEHVAKSKPAIVTSLFGTIWTVIELILLLLP